MPPKTIAGRYVVERAVGHGGMGTVWLCRDEVLGRSVAVKQVGNMPGETTSDVNRALREARSSAALNHRNVVSIYDAVEDGDHNWLVMEYVPSRTLAEILAEESRLTPERAAWIGAQAADGLAAAHARNTMHRDVKPGNILVTEDDHVKIMDFGISRTSGDDQLTRSGLITGTPSYFSPEIARGEEPGLPADVWALGATLYAAVEGHAPYPDRGNAIALLATIASEPVPPPERADFLAEPIARMMDRDPATRWSMADAAHLLHRLHDKHGAAARPEPTVTLAAPGAAPAVDAPEPTPSTPEPDLAPEPEAVPVPVPVPASTPTRERPRPPAPQDDRRRPGGRLLAVGAVMLLVLVAVAGFLLLRGPDQAPSATEPDESQSTGSAPQEPSSKPDTQEPQETNPPESTVPPPPTQTAPVVSDMGAFAEQYYGYLPGDTKSAYDLLSPAYQAGESYGDYQGFWRTVSALEVHGTSAVAGESAVDVDLTYVTSRGREDETHRLYLEQTSTGYVIVDDEAV